MKMVYTLPVLAILLATALSSVFIVDVREKVLVLQFGEVKQVVDEPGLYFKVPFIQEVFRYDDRILGLVTDPQEFTLGDSRRLVVDAFARWRIVDLQKFRRAVGVGGIDAARDNLAKIVNPEIRDVLGGVSLQAVLSEDRVALMNKIRDNAKIKAATLGIEVIDVRLTRTDLPKQNLEATYSRMQAERQRDATDEIARGNEAAQTIRAEADRQAVETTSEANKQAAIIRGQADAKRSAIYAEAYGKDPEFFAFTRSLSAYATAFKPGNTAFVLAPKGEFFQYLGAESPNLAAGPSAADIAGTTGATGNGSTVAGGRAPTSP
ncbi:protease modulator HflC [bacterium]|nr:protease modulator HflC [bacterium]